MEIIMDNGEKVLKYIEQLKSEYESKLNFVSWAMLDIIEEFKKEPSRSLTIGDLEHGYFRSLEANFIRHPRSYKLATKVNLDNGELDLAVCQELVKLFRTVAQIERGDK